MKRNLLVGFIIVSLGLFFSNEAFTNRGGAPNGRTAAPGESNCSVSCHTGNYNPNSSLLSIDFDNGASSYVAGQTVSITIENSASASVWGFSVTALDNNNNKIGTLVLTDAARTRLRTGTKDYITQTTQGSMGIGGKGSWTFDWTAPSSGAGDVTFYVASVAGNGNGRNTGDAVYSNNLTVTEALMPGYNDPDLRDLSLSFNPFAYSLILSELSGQGIAVFELSDLQGRIIQSERLLLNASDKHNIDLENILENGLYIASVTDDSGIRKSAKVFIAN